MGGEAQVRFCEGPGVRFPEILWRNQGLLSLMDLYAQAS